MLNLKDYCIKNAIWQNFPLSFEKYKLGPQLLSFAQRRKSVLEECFCRDGNVCNKTPDIPFERGRITPLCDRYKPLLRRTMRVDKRNALTEEERSDIESIEGWVDEGNCKGAEALSFIVLNCGESVVGYIKVSKGGYFSMRDSIDTYNLEYYTLPEHRRKGFMKEALKAFMQAVLDGKIQYVENDPMLNYFVEPEILPLKILNAIIQTSNLSSAKTIEAVGGFEKQGTIKWASRYDDDANLMMDEAFCYTRVFL